MTTIQLVAILSPFLSAGLAAFLTFQITSKLKKLDIIYQNKLPAFKDLSTDIISFKNYCESRIAYYQGSEFHPFYSDSVGSLEHRVKIATSFENNVDFFSREARQLISDFVNQMGGLCSAELGIAGGEDDLQPVGEYQRMATLGDSLVELLYNELNLPKSK